MKNINWISVDEFKKKVSLGDMITNHWASKENPHRRGYFIKFVKRTGRLNPGLHVEMTDKMRDGNTWLVICDNESRFSFGWN